MLDKFLSDTVIIDTESTGLDIENEDIVEFAYCIWDDEQTPSDFVSISKFYGSREPIKFSSSAINNISRKMIEGLPLFSDTLDETLPILDSFKYIVCHNVDYDYKILNANIKRGGVKDLDDYSEAYKDKWICTMRIARRLFLNKQSPDGEEEMRYGQNFLRYFFDLDSSMDVNKVGNNHRADTDAYICGHLLLKLIDVAVNDGVINLEQDIGEQLVNLTWVPVPIEYWPYGNKWKGTKISDIPDSYFLWAIDNLDELNEKSYRYNDDVAQAVIAEVNKRIESQNG